MLSFHDLSKKLFIIAGPNVIESEEHVLMMANELKNIFKNYNVNFIFKVSFDKANRTSLNSYRGVSFEQGLKILEKIKNNLKIPILTDIHENWQAEPISKIVDIIQIPAFLCRQTDLLKAVAETGKIIHVKKGQFCSSDVMHKTKEKLIAFGNPQVILCERGNSFGYQDLIVDPRNLIWLKSKTNLTSMDITHCLQRPSQKMSDGTIKAGGDRDLIPFMGKMALALDVNGLFLEVHDRPDYSLCDAPTQWYLNKMEWLLDVFKIEKYIRLEEICILCKKKINNYNIIYDKIRGDTNNKCKIIQCLYCNHIQLIGFRENLKNHYEEDNQTNDIIKHFNITKKDIIDKEKIEILRRIKYLDLEEKNYNVLDVGSGYCSFGKILSNKNIKVTCLEPSVKRTETGKLINNISKDDNIEIKNIYLDNNFVERNENNFDIITLWHVLEHIDEKTIDNLIKNVYNCCKLNGRIIIEVPNSDDELLRLDRYKRINYMVHHLSYWNGETLSKLMLNNGINNFKIEYVQRYGFKNYLNWVYNLGQKQDCDMNNDKKDLEWLNAKKKSKNTDALLMIIYKI